MSGQGQTGDAGPPPLAGLTPDQLIHYAAPERDRFPYTKDTDLEAEVLLLYSVVRLLRPPRVVELGTRYGTSTRVIADALNGSGTLYTIDPVDCRPHLENVPCTVITLPGESAFDGRPDLHAELLFVDTEPHSYEQTLGWLDTWVWHRLVPGGVALFHDIVPARRGIRVRDAVRAWLKARHDPTWTWLEYHSPWRVRHGPYGLGLLWRAETETGHGSPSA